MKVNEVIKELKKIRNEYGNVEVKIFEGLGWGDTLTDGIEDVTEIYFNHDTKQIEIY